jgi:phosphoglycerate kinase
MPKFRTLDDIDVRGKRVLLRADLNVPMRNGVVTDVTRIERLAPTIDTLLDRGAKVIVMSHFGRPAGKRDPAFTLWPLTRPLSRAIGGRDVVFAEDGFGDADRVSLVPMPVIRVTRKTGAQTLQPVNGPFDD